MVEPADKQRLLDLMELERAGWDALISQFSEERILEPGVVGDWSVKDVIAHVAAYEDWTAEQIESGRRGEVPSPQEYEDMGSQGWYDVDFRNRYMYEQNKDKPIEQVLEESQEAFNKLFSVVQSLSEKELKSTQWWTQERTLFDVIPSQTYGHYHEHDGALRAWLSQDSRAGVTAAEFPVAD